MDARERYDEICDDLAARNPEVMLTQMMGMPAVKADGKLLDPGGNGRPFKEWVVVPEAHASRWPGFAEQALAQRTT